MELTQGVILLDSLGDLQTGNTSPILVCGSHCGGNRELAGHVKNCNVQAVFLNNAGIGKNHAGIRGLLHYEAEGILACAVSHNSAEIGIAIDTWESGIISHTNRPAEAAGIRVGNSVKEAVAIITAIIKKPLLNAKSDNTNLEQKNSANNGELKKQVQTQIDGVNITVTDSITFLNNSNAGNIVVCGSHGGMSAGHYAQKYGVQAVFFNDAGIGKNNAGVKSLESLSSAGILACTVNCMSAEIFNGRDVLENGIISVCNQQAMDINISENMTVQEAVKILINKTI